MKTKTNKTKKLTNKETTLMFQYNILTVYYKAALSVHCVRTSLFCIWRDLGWHPELSHGWSHPLVCVINTLPHYPASHILHDVRLFRLIGKHGSKDSKTQKQLKWLLLKDVVPFIRQLLTLMSNKRDIIQEIRTTDL